MTRWWAVALLSLSVGINLGLVVAVVQQRFAPPAPAPTVLVVPSPQAAAAAPAPAESPPEQLSEVAPPPVAVAPPLRAPVAPVNRDREPAPPDQLADDFGDPPPPLFGDEAGVDEPGPGGRGPGRPGSGGLGPNDPRGDGPSPARLEEMAERLGVPPADRPRFIALQRTFIAETRQRHVQLEATRRALRAELLAPNPDPQRLHAYVDDTARLQAALERAFVDHVLAARQLLDGEAERRYLQFLSRLGPRAGGPGPQRDARPVDPRWRRDRPWRPGLRPGMRGGGGGARRFYDEPSAAPTPI
ncbi:MAG TPA: periplasmic heavy metal sensor [Thermoanaerobaculia bacterium]|jgi:hypothetical protein|nr:periplasmic heavy metal sensor [Thermoanaerobaculia bacterium]